MSPKPVSLLLALVVASPGLAEAPVSQPVATFSIVAADPEAGEVGVAVASRFFAVGTVVPHAKAGVGAVATQSFARISFGPGGLELLDRGLTPGEAIDVLTRSDEGRGKRQIGMVSADGGSATFTGGDCNAWAGGKRGDGYAVQGNILTGPEVVEAMEKAFLASAGQPLGHRLFLALSAGEEAGGDSRGKQSAALVVKRERAGYGGESDQAIDIRVDDHEDPVTELRRLLDLALVNDLWNRGWTAFSGGQYPEALKWQEKTAERAVGQAVEPEVLYDLAVIRWANQDAAGAREALERAIAGNSKLATQAKADPDLEGLELASP